MVEERQKKDDIRNFVVLKHVYSWASVCYTGELTAAKLVWNVRWSNLSTPSWLWFTQKIYYLDDLLKMLEQI